jgi:hypothetical protein
MPATYPSHVIDPSDIPQAGDPSDQHLLDVYAGEINKTASVWRAFDAGTLGFRPHPKSATVGEVYRCAAARSRRSSSAVRRGP